MRTATPHPRRRRAGRQAETRWRPLPRGRTVAAEIQNGPRPTLPPPPDAPVRGSSPAPPLLARSRGPPA
ncbi:hypothetical protein chiPu_0022513, partial [Chiloscyllium punctatum]|nr:hypothetical protein [Chiloscyllium punctatum]